MIKELFPSLDHRFFMSWIVTSVVMFSMYSFLHGYVLNDFVLLNVANKIVFLSMSAVVYLVIGFVITWITYRIKKIKNSFKHGVTVGAALGTLIYLMTFTLGFSFTTQLDPSMVLFDFGWQVLEQTVGGLFCGWVYRSMYIMKYMYATK